MSKWADHGSFKIIRCDSNLERKQKEAFGYGGRTISRLCCTECHMVTMVDETIRYDYCPHCGTKMYEEE